MTFVGTLLFVLNGRTISKLIPFVLSRGEPVNDMSCCFSSLRCAIDRLYSMGVISSGQ